MLTDIDSTVLLSTAMLGRMFATGAYYICLQCASEVFPTVIRGKGVATCEIMGGVGLFVCPMIVYLVSDKLSFGSTTYWFTNAHFMKSHLISEIYS